MKLKKDNIEKAIIEQTQTRAQKNQKLTDTCIDIKVVEKVFQKKSNR